MRWIIGAAWVIVEITTDHDAFASPRRRRFRDEDEAARLLRHLAESPGKMAQLRQVLAYAAPFAALSLADDREVVAALARKIVAGRLVVLDASHRRPALWSQESATGDEEQRGEAPAPRKDAEEPRSWIEIELLDWDDEAIAYEPFELTLPDGGIHQGVLDRRGFARVDGIDPGTCKLRFPRRDETCWDPLPEGPRGNSTLGRGSKPEPPPAPPDTRAIAAANLPKTSWIDLELLDEDDKPIPDALYRVEAADGAVIEGRLGQSGRAHVEGIVFGSCRVTFPELDGGDLDKS